MKFLMVILVILAVCHCPCNSFCIDTIGEFKPPAAGSKIELELEGGRIVNGTCKEITSERVYLYLDDSVVAGFKRKDISANTRWKYFKPDFDNKPAEMPQDTTKQKNSPIAEIPLNKEEIELLQKHYSLYQTDFKSFSENGKTCYGYLKYKSYKEKIYLKTSPIRAKYLLSLIPITQKNKLFIDEANLYYMAFDFDPTLKIEDYKDQIANCFYNAAQNFIAKKNISLASNCMNLISDLDAQYTIKDNGMVLKLKESICSHYYKESMGYYSKQQYIQALNTIKTVPYSLPANNALSNDISTLIDKLEPLAELQKAKNAADDAKAEAKQARVEAKQQAEEARQQAEETRQQVSQAAEQAKQMAEEARQQAEETRRQVSQAADEASRHAEEANSIAKEKNRLIEENNSKAEDRNRILRQMKDDAERARNN